MYISFLVFFILLELLVFEPVVALLLIPFLNRRGAHVKGPPYSIIVVGKGGGKAASGNNFS